MLALHLFCVVGYSSVDSFFLRSKVVIESVFGLGKFLVCSVRNVSNLNLTSLGNIQSASYCMQDAHTSYKARQDSGKWRH